MKEKKEKEAAADLTNKTDKSHIVKQEWTSTGLHF